jgi:hypothetical protein
MKKDDIESRRRGISYIQWKEGRLRIGHILCRNCLLKHVIEGKLKGREDEEEDVSRYWIR